MALTNLQNGLEKKREREDETQEGKVHDTT